MHETYLQKTLRILIYVFDMLYSIQCLPSFFSIQPSLCAVFDAISSNIDEAVSIEPSANAIVFGDFNVHHKNWVTSSSENDIHIKFQAPVFVLHCICLYWRILIILMFQFPSTFLQIQKGMLLIIAQLMTILMLIVIGFAIIREMFHWRIYVNLVLLLLVLNFVEGPGSN